jgi:hypothetical protein
MVEEHKIFESLTEAEKEKLHEEESNIAVMVLNAYPLIDGQEYNVWAGMDRTLMAFEDNNTRYPAQSTIVHASYIARQLGHPDNVYSLEELLEHTEKVDNGIGWPWHSYEEG